MQNIWHVFGKFVWLCMLWIVHKEALSQVWCRKLCNTWLIALQQVGISELQPRRKYKVKVNKKLKYFLLLSSLFLFLFLSVWIKCTLLMLLWGDQLLFLFVWQGNLHYCYFLLSFSSLLSLSLRLWGIIGCVVVTAWTSLSQESFFLSGREIRPDWIPPEAWMIL